MSDETMIGNAACECQGHGHIAGGTFCGHVEPTEHGFSMCVCAYPPVAAPTPMALPEPRCEECPGSQPDKCDQCFSVGGGPLHPAVMGRIRQNPRPEINDLLAYLDRGELTQVEARRWQRWRFALRQLRATLARDVATPDSRTADAEVRNELREWQHAASSSFFATERALDGAEEREARETLEHAAYLLDIDADSCEAKAEFSKCEDDASLYHDAAVDRRALSRGLRALAARRTPEAS